MPTRRPSPLSRAVVKKSTPVGRDCALVLPTASAQPLELSYWDLWFALVADADFDGSWDRFVEHLRGQKNQGGSSRLAERKLSHRPTLASGSGPRDTHEHAWTHGIDCPEHWTRSQSDLANAVRHDGVDGAGDHVGYGSGAPGADAVDSGRGRIRESLFMLLLSGE
jgi:hypothetical protein